MWIRSEESLSFRFLGFERPRVNVLGIGFWVFSQAI